MTNLICFETPPVGVAQASEASSSSACFHGGHQLDLSLGISLSRSGGGGGGSCGAAGCGGGARTTSRTGDVGGGARTTSSTGDVGGGGLLPSASSDDVVRAGYGCHGAVDGSSWAAAFMPSPSGFMHPWSLAARQQKAAAEQHRSFATTTYVTSHSDAARVVSLPAAAVGWPPVHTTRRHLVAAVHTPRPDAAMKLVDAQGDEKAEVAAVDETAAAAAAPTPPLPTSCADAAVGRRRPRTASNMFAKVHMDGCQIGRKINLRAHRSYDSLSRALNKMIRNFFCPADYSISNSGEDCSNTEDLIFLYEDFEGDRMLLGDVPWELFLASAKRLYIAQNPTSQDHKGNAEAGKADATKETPTTDEGSN